jgi:hypothetical protein
MFPKRGRHIPLSLPRRLIADLMHFSQMVPTFSAERRMNLAPLVQARRSANPKPSWSAIFLKAFALLAARVPEFRRAYVRFPWPHLYEHPENIAAITILRRLGDEEAVFFANLRAPERRSLATIDDYLRHCREQPLASIGSFRRALRVSRLPWLLRRLVWWVGLNVSGKQRSRCFGTFGLSLVSGLGAGQVHALSPLTTLIWSGSLERDGTLPVRVGIDHRVMDGALVARSLMELEAILLGEVLAEVRKRYNTDQTVGPVGSSRE